MIHFFDDIPGWLHCADLYREMVVEAADGAHFVEVGCWKGRSAAFMAVEIANSGKDIGFDCVDHWQGNAGRPDDPDVLAGRLFDVFLRNTAPARKWINPLRLCSIEAAALNCDGSLDFVYLDAAHDYRSVQADIAAWLPKIKLGGMLAGDDYRMEGVRMAVDGAFGSAVELRGEGKAQHWIARL